MKTIKSVELQSGPELLRDEQGQIVILFTLCLIPLVFLLALVFNTSKLAVRKMEKQNAADSAAVAGSVWMARGANLTALNNNGMSEAISVMITLRSTLQTAETMAELLPAMAAAVWYIPPLAAEYEREAEVYRALALALKPVDRALSAQSTGFGWRMMSALDRLNQSIKAGFPPMAYAKAIEMARANGANKAPFNVVLAGLPTSGMPMYPTARGPQRILVDEASCVLSKLKRPIYPLLLVAGPASVFVSIPVFEGMIACNKASLTGGDGFCGYVPGITPPLQWPENPPRPMILSDAPVRAAAATTDKTEAEADLAHVRKYLQYLSVAFGQLDKQSTIGANYFQNPASQWLTYGQADVYNPSLWSLFKRDWRAQLVRSNVFSEKIGEVSRLAGGGGGVTGSPTDWAFINVH